MRASEWQFLCAVHESPKSCCAIDYCCHTLDWATNIVTSQKIFPSRLSLGAGDGVDDRGAGVKHLINIFRRLHRIFAHAWFQHRGVFWQTGLYVLFKTVCDTYELLPAENYKLPPEAEGLEPQEEVKAAVPTILKAQPSDNVSSVEEEFISVGRNNTRRHIRQSPSVGSAVTTVLEQDEEDPVVTQKLAKLTLTEEDAEAEEEGTTEIPVIVETYDVDEEEAQPEPVSEPVETAEEPTASTELSEKTEEPREADPVVEEVKAEAEVEVEAAPEAEIKESEVKEETPAKEETPLEGAEEEKKVEES
jgi:hypothetical protein